MKKILLIISLIIISITQVYSQSNESFENKKDSINNEIKKIDTEISKLEKKRELLVSNRTELSGQKIKKEFQNKLSQGIELETSFMGGVLRDTPSFRGNEITKIPKKTKIIVYDSDSKKSTYFKTKYNGKLGYLSKSSIVFIDELKKIESQKAKNNLKLEELKKLYGTSNALNIMKKKYWIGMTSGMATESLGSPNDINKSTGSWGVHEQWIYDNRDLYLYFENGKLTSYQN